MSNSGANFEGLLPTSVTRSSVTGAPKSSAKSPGRLLEEYTSETIVSESTNCTSIINSALNDTGARGVPIKLLGKNYLSEGSHVIPSNIYIEGIGCYIDNKEGSLISLESSIGAVNLFASESWGAEVAVDANINLHNMGLYGFRNAQPERGEKAVPQTYLMSPFLSSATSAEVKSTEGFASSGLIWLGKWMCKYTGKTSITFTGITKITSGSGELSAGAWIIPHKSVGHVLALQAKMTRSTNLSVTSGQGSSIIIQGTPENIAYQNNFVSLRASTCNRFAIELNEEATDNNFISPELGPYCGMGIVLDRGADNHFEGPHLVGYQSPAGASVILAANKPRWVAPFFDSIGFSGIRVDTSIRGGNGNPQDIQMIGIRGTSWNWNASPSTSFITTRRGGNEKTLGGEFAGVIGDEHIPNYKAGVRIQPTAQLVGEQNPTTLSISEGGSGLLQIDSVADFLPAPTAAQTISISSDTCSYSSKSVSIGRTTTEATVGVASLVISTVPVPMSATFATGGGIFLLGGGPGRVAAQEIKYTSYNASTFTFSGIPTTGAGSITSAVPAEAVVSQCLIIGLTGATSHSARASGTAVTMATQPMFSGTAFALDYRTPESKPFQLTTTDIYTVKRNWMRSGKPSFFQTVVTIAEGASSAEAAHGLFTTPTILTESPQVDPGVASRLFVTATSTNVKVELKGITAPTGGLPITITAECLPTA